MRLGVTFIVALVAVTAITGPAAADNTPPLVDAGVDQTVSPGTTVYLDANGSTDPDGTIDTVSWTIERPGGGTQTPACQSCRTTEFEATTTGEYLVTLEVTDDTGATRSDTLYVTVRTEDSPTVSLSGSERVDRDTDMTLTADIESGGPALDMVAWMTDGDVIDKHSISGTTAEPELTHSFETTGEKQVTAVVYDSLGKRASTTHTVTVTKPLTSQSVSTNTGGGGGGGGGSPCPDTMPLYNDGNFVGCRTGADSVYQSGDKRVIVDTNDKPGIQMHNGDSLVTYSEDNKNLEKRSKGQFRVKTEPGKSVSESLESGKIVDDDSRKKDSNSGGPSAEALKTYGSSDGGYRVVQKDTDNNDGGNSNSGNSNSGNSNSGNSNSGNSNSGNSNSGNSNSGNSNSGNSNSGNDDNIGSAVVNTLFSGDDSDDGGGDDSGNSGNNDDSGGGLFGGLF